MTEKRFVERYAGRTIKRLIGIEDIETNRVCVTIEENIYLLNELADENNELKEENEQLKKENKELREELNFYKNQCIDEDIKYLRENTVWEQMPTKTRTYTKTSIRDDLND